MDPKVSNAIGIGIQASEDILDALPMFRRLQQVRPFVGLRHVYPL